MERVLIGQYGLMGWSYMPDYTVVDPNEEEAAA